MSFTWMLYIPRQFCNRTYRIWDCSEAFAEEAILQILYVLVHILKYQTAISDTFGQHFGELLFVTPHWRTFFLRSRGHSRINNPNVSIMLLVSSGSALKIASARRLFVSLWSCCWGKRTDSECNGNYRVGKAACPFPCEDARSKRIKPTSRPMHLATPATNMEFTAAVLSDEYTNCIPNPKHMPKYTKAKVPHTQDKHS